MWQQLEATMLALSDNPAVRCVIVRGGDEAFAAGGDLEEFLTARDTVDKAMHYHRCVGRALEVDRRLSASDDRGHPRPPSVAA